MAPSIDGNSIYSFLMLADMSFWITAGSIFLLLILSGFFSGSETALTAASRGKLHALAEEGSKGARRALTLRDNSERLIGGILLGNNLVNILAASLATALFTRFLGDSGVIAATLVMTVLVLVFAEVLPKTYAITNPERAALRTAGPISVIVSLLSPFVSAVTFVVSLMLRALGQEAQKKDEAEEAQAEIAGAISLAGAEGSVKKEARDRLLGSLDLKDRTVDEIMLHRSSIEMINSQDKPQDILRQCLESRYTRLPLFEDNSENIIGVIHAKDLLRAMNRKVAPSDEVTRFSIQDILAASRPPYFVPETTRLEDQMRQFLERRSHFALVVDEYGALQGLITLEDILEEIVGEITDEYDDEDEKVTKKDTEGNYLVDGSATLRDLNRAYDWNLPVDEANTIAGLVIHEAQVIPNIGQVFHFHGFRIEIVEKELNRISLVKMKEF